MLSAPKKPPPKSKGMERDGLLEWRDQGSLHPNVVTRPLHIPTWMWMALNHLRSPPVTSWLGQHGRMDGDRKLFPAPQASQEGWQDLPSNRLKRPFIGQFEDSEQSASSHDSVSE